MADDQGSGREDVTGQSPTAPGLNAAAVEEAPADTTPAQARPTAAPTSSDTEPDPEPDPTPDPMPDPKPDAKADLAPEASGPAKPERDRRRGSRLWWALPILMLVELYVYGHDGRLEVCVGKEGETDFSLVGQERTDANRWKFPRCETRENLGLRSQKEERVKEGLTAACRGATIFRHQGEAKLCIAEEQGWEHRVQGRFVFPWEPAYYRHLFWFLQ